MNLNLEHGFQLAQHLADNLVCMASWHPLLGEALAFVPEELNSEFIQQKKSMAVSLYLTSVGSGYLFFSLCTVFSALQGLTGKALEVPVLGCCCLFYL